MLRELKIRRKNPGSALGAGAKQAEERRESCSGGTRVQF
jgi:hypothetical protein